MKVEQPLDSYPNIRGQLSLGEGGEIVIKEGEEKTVTELLLSTAANCLTPQEIALMRKLRPELIDLFR